MISLFSKRQRWLASLCAAFLLATGLWISPLSSASALAASQESVNVILMIGDGMGWEAARAAAVAKGAEFYKSGKGRGLSFQKLSGYTLESTWGTTVPLNLGESTEAASSRNALTGASPITGQSPLRPGFGFNPTPNPGSLSHSTLTPGKGCAVTSLVGNIVGYDPSQGGPNPWTPLTPPAPNVPGPGYSGVANYNRNYIKCSYPDSANTATSLYTGEKSYNSAVSVDIYEQNLKTVLQTAHDLGKATGVVTSVPITHATPGAAISTVNRRNKYDNDFPALDNILQEALRQDEDSDVFLPTVLLGGGHPLDFQNATSVSPAYGYEYIKQSTYDELRAKSGLNGQPLNRYGYTFLERDTQVVTTNNLNQIVDGGQRLLTVAQALDPNKGDRLLGLYGARGQNGNLPHQTANRDFSETGTDAFFLAGGTNAAQVYTTQVATRDTVRPLATGIGETDAQFIAKERKANPTLAQLTTAALNVLEKDPDGFWLMVEGGDVDWALHDNHLDNLIGNMLAFDDAVQTVIDWVADHGGWTKNALIVTADHDHYWTLTENYPKLLKQFGAETLTFGANAQTPATAGYFTGSDPTKKYGWNSHSNRLPPVYYQGKALNLEKYIGQPVEFVDNPPGGVKQVYQIPGVPGAIDQTNIYRAMVEALSASPRR